MTKIAGRYEIKAKLGEGGMGVVFRAYDPPPMDREVAVKTLHEFADPLALELFYKECTALKSVCHPNIVEIFDIGEYEDAGHRRPFFVMPLLQGTTVDQLIRHASHRLTVDRIVEIFTQTCRGLHAAHEYGLVHRDLKPSNIFVMADDSVKIIDFGVAHAVHTQSRSTGYDKGTLLYMAPEQIQHKPVSVQSDIYSLGVTLYETLTRRQPFRAGTESAVTQAILTQIPPPASELNPAVSHVISRVVHKAMAKQAWNRFDTAREFGDMLQKAWRNEPIALFDPARTQPRIQTATRALEKGDYQFAAEIVGELEAEGNIDPQITLLRAQVDQISHQKTVAQLLESARARYEEEEDPLALQKLQEVLQLDPTNMTALGLKGKIEARRSERQIEKWIQLARQHIDNHSYSHAREALQNALVLRPKDTRASRLLKEIEVAEEEYVRLRREKTEIYQSAVKAWQNGEVSQALSQMKHVLDLDRQAPDGSAPDATNAYQSFYDKLRSEHDAINSAYAEARRNLAERQFAKALQTCRDFLTRYAGHALFQALAFDIEEQQRQQLSAFIADVDRRLDAETDLDAKVSLLHEALIEYPEEDHFKRLAKLLEDKRDLVNSIVERARVHEEAGQFAEAISDYETLQTIYAGYPGVSFEKERLQKRLQQHARDAARAAWVRQIDAQLSAGDYSRATALLEKAEGEFPADGELAELRNLVRQGQERVQQADQLVAEGQELCAQGEFEQGVERLNAALQLDDRTTVRLVLRDLFVTHGQAGLATDWRVTEAYAAKALELDPNYLLAKSLRAQALDKKREEEILRCASESRRLQGAGQIEAAIAEVERGLAAYPGDTRLGVISDALRKELAPSPIVASDAYERTRLVTDRRAGQPLQPPHVESNANVEREAVAAAEPAPPASVPTTPAPAAPRIPKVSASRRPLRLAVAAIALASGAVLVVSVIQRNRVPAETATIAAPTTAPEPEPPAPTAAPTAAVEPAASAVVPPQSADLVIQQLPPGTRVLVDDVLVGTVGSDGTLSHAGIAAGRHALQFSLRGYDTVTLTEDFTTAQTLTLTSANVKLTKSPSTLDLRADSGTDITISQAGRTIQRVNGPAKITVPEGSYDLVVTGPAGVPTSRRVSASAGTSVTVEVRDLIVSGMERFDGGGWTNQDMWFTRRGGNFVLYSRPFRDATISFTILLNRRGNPFSSGSRLNWVVGYLDGRNYVLLQLDREGFYRSVITGGAPQPPTQIKHRIPTNAPYVTLRVRVAGTQLIHEFSMQENVWQTIDAWNAVGADSGRPVLDGSFGYFLPGSEALTISNFRYYPLQSTRPQ
jgi:eukaryotic-like serine/threonine-protein kinase